MPTLRDLVSAIRQRPGIDAAVVVGRDGLVVAGDASPAVDLDELAARVPPLIQAIGALASSATTAVVAHEGGHVVCVFLGDDTVLLLLAHGPRDLAPLIADVRRYRERIAELV